LLQNHIIIIFAANKNIMKDFTLSEAEWEILKLKVLRKYNHLSEEDLAYTAGQEEILVNRLAKRLKRDENYVLFTLKKGLADLNSNRL
jgi:hypothetical protein